MSKAVSISEGGKGRIFPQTDKLKINNVGGGNSLWLPEDEVVTGTLYADENGIYLAENDGFSCYDTVVVRVEDETDPDDPDWELDPDELDEDVWDEESYEEYQEDPEAFEEKYNDKEKWKAEKAKKEKSQKIKKVKSLKPSKITGIDPVDGNPYQVGVDPEGNLTKEMLPSSIHIVVPPWKREYENGEEINFYGMHVYLLDKDGHPFKTEQYPTGEIPFGELILPVTIAEGGGGSEQYADITDKTGLPEEVINAIPIMFCSAASLDTDGLYIGGGGGEGTSQYKDLPYITIESATSDVYAFITNNDLFNQDCLVSKEPFVVRVTTHNEYGVYSNLRNGTKTSVKDNDFYIIYGSASQIKDRTFNIGSNRVDIHTSEVGYVILYGDTTKTGNEIPVQWIRSDGTTLEDSFAIEVGESE